AGGGAALFRLRASSVALERRGERPPGRARRGVPRRADDLDRDMVGTGGAMLPHPGPYLVRLTAGDQGVEHAVAPAAGQVLVAEAEAAEPPGVVRQRQVGREEGPPQLVRALRVGLEHDAELRRQ